MSVVATASFAYGAFSRWQLWFDNPNKAAVLFASLALVALAVAVGARRRAWAVVAWVALAGFGHALFHTFSRGGLLAFGIGAPFLVWWSVRRGRCAAALLCVLLGLALLPIGRSAVTRLATSAPAQDASVANRLLLWRTVPRMMADAPGGWGLGESGAAFMSWYQPLERRETYRTLVGSHVTWLVEFGRRGRIAYLAGWLAVIGLCGAFWMRRRNGLPLALWLCLGTASAFSSVAEAWELWVLPAASLVPVAWSVRTRRQVRSAGWILGIACALGGGVTWMLESVGRRQSGAAELRVGRDRARGRTVLSARSAGGGDGRSCPWIVADAEVLGGAGFGRVLRARVWRLPGRVWGIADSLDAVPAETRQLTLCGKAASADPSELARFPNLEDVRILSPERPQAWLSARFGGRVACVCCGEFAASCPECDPPGLTVVPGMRDYLPEWPVYAFGSRDELR